MLPVIPPSGSHVGRDDSVPEARLAGDRAPGASSVVDLRTSYSPRLDRLRVDDGRLFVILLHGTCLTSEKGFSHDFRRVRFDRTFPALGILLPNDLPRPAELPPEGTSPRSGLNHDVNGVPPQSLSLVFAHATALASITSVCSMTGF